MNRDALTLLGCSGSLVLTLLIVNPAKANAEPIQELVFTAPVANPLPEVNKPVDKDNIDHSYTLDNSKYSSLNPDSDTVGDLAIAKLGCDCAGCRNTVMQMAQTGQLTVPK
jgi:hypothetical protein